MPQPAPDSDQILLERFSMHDPVTIDVHQAYRKCLAGHATLVCAYASEEKCRSMRLDGALSYQEFLAQRQTIPWNREIIFYCA